MYVSELFFGWQGEGPHAGVPQAFVRFAGCPLRCAYCDTPESLFRTPTCKLRTAGEYARDGIEEVPNPVSADWVAEQAARLASRSPGGAVHSVSLTGGEPLIQSEAIAELLPLLKRKGLPSYLETAGILPERFAPLAADLDHVAMDLKLPSAGGQEERWEEHAAFLAYADPERTSAKLVVTEGTEERDVLRAGELLVARSTRIPVFLQPATPVWRGVEPPSSERLRRWAGRLQASGLRVFSGPQWQPPKVALRSPAPAALARG